MKIKNLVIISLFCLVTGGWEIFQAQAHRVGNFETDNKAGRIQQISSYIQQAMLTAASGEAYDRLGVSVAVSGDTVAVGAHGDDVNGNFNQGSVYVFQFEDGTWIQRAMLTASDGSPNSFLGQEVVMNENFIVASSGDEVYVYDKPVSGWITATETITIPTPSQADGFGASMALQGNTLVIGARGTTVNGNDEQGAVYVYEYQAEQWELKAELTASDGAADDGLGDVDMDSDTIVAGAGFKDVGSSQNQGAAYVFVEPPAGWITGTETAILTASDGEPMDYFGFATSIYSDTIVIGSSYDEIGNNWGQGSAYIFTKPGGGWITATETAKLIASDGAEGDCFGISVEAWDGQVMIGAMCADINSNLAQGAVYVFSGNGSTWIQQEKLTAYDGGGDDSDFFGQSISFDGNTLLIGAYGSDIGANLDQGAAYVFVEGIPCTPTPTLTNTPQPTITNTPTPTMTHTPTQTPTVTNIPTDTPTQTPTATNGPTNTPTQTPTDTNVPTNTPTQTPTDTNVPTNTPTPTPTITPTPRNPLFCPIVIRE